MRSFAVLFLGSVATLAIGVNAAKAADNSFTSHHAVVHQPYAAYISRAGANDKLEVRRYFNYEEREPCQNYLPPPAGLARHGCNLAAPATPPAPFAEPIKTERTVTYTTGKDLAVSNVLSSYEVHFDFDSAKIESEGNQTLDQIARDIKKYNLSEVVVAGHADRAGPADYNEALSQRRADAVSRGLRDRGIENRVLDEEAHGENDPLVPTKDGVPLRENRRVEIQFRR